MTQVKRTKSKRPGKQRKFALAAPLHIKQKFLSCTLSKELRTSLKKRNIPVRKGDEVIATTGQFKGKKGKVNQVMLKKTKVYVEGFENIKKDGSKAFYPIHPSNLMITKIGSEDKKRKKLIERK